MIRLFGKVTLCSGATAFVFFSCTSALCTSVIGDNTGYTTYSTVDTFGLFSYAQMFTMSSADTLGSVKLSLQFSGNDSAPLYLYNATSDVPTDLLSTLGTVGDYNGYSTTINGLNISLSSGTSYAIVLGPDTASGLTWDNTANPLTVGGSSASFGESYVGFGGWSRQGSIYQQMALEPVPEVPTGVDISFGVLVIAAGRILCRKFCPAV